jgi:hypothetical protein
MFPVKVETRILLNCPHCRFSSRYDTGFLEDAIHDGKEISCVACGCHFEIVVRKVEAAQPSAHPTVATGCPYCGVSAEDIELLNESLASDRNGG